MTAPAPRPPLASLRDFTRNPLRAGRELRDALHTDSAAFLSALIQEGELDVNDRGFRYAILLLLHNDLLIPALATPSVTTFDQALRLTRALLEMDSNFINSLLTALLMRQDLKSTPCTLRVLDLIGECWAHLANWRSLARIHHDGDAQVRLKCAALLARYRFDDRAGLERFRRSEPRVRANIIQMLWDVSQAQAHGVLNIAIHDENNRVAGNACLALYRAGDTRSLAKLESMLESAEPKDRITAAWVVGQTRDGRFASRLLDGAHSEIPALRRIAIASLAKLQPVRIAETPGTLAIDFLPEPECVPPTIWLRVTGADGQFLSGIRPVDFLPWVGERLLFHYNVEEVSHKDETSLRIVYPAASETARTALEAALAVKPGSQLWMLSAYGVGSPDQPSLEANPETLMAQLASGAVAGPDAATVIRGALAAPVKVADRHIVILPGVSASENSTDDNREEVRALAEAQQIRVHDWRKRKADTLTALPLLVRVLQNRYVLSSPEQPSAIAIRIHSENAVEFSARCELPGDDT